MTLPGGHTYVVFVDLWGGADSVDSVLHAWFVPDSDEGNLTVEPSSQEVTLGGSFETALTWSVDAGARYMGTVDFTSEEGYIDSTIVNVVS
ncbi:hypothetical protein GCM10029992_09130 [Glycomyces albus]